MAELGEEFRAAREARSLSLSDVSEQIHIRSVYLQAIEDGDWPGIGAPVYVRGFLRTYARFLGLDPEPAVAAYAASAGAYSGGQRSVVAQRAVASRAPTLGGARAERRGPGALLAILAVVAIAVIGALAYAILVPGGAKHRDAAVVDAPSAAVPRVVATPVRPPKPTAPVVAVQPTLGVRVTQESWLRVTVDGRQIVEGIYPPGTVKAFHGGTVDVRAGNAGGVELTRNGKALGPMGPPGDVIERSIKLAADSS